MALSIKSTFDNFKNNIVETFKGNLEHKIKSPFLSTFIIVWIVYNWQFVYSLFYFDSNYNLERRIETIQGYFNNYTFWGNVFPVIWKSFLVLSLTYFLVNLSKLIVVFFEKLVNPAVLKIASKSKVVDREELEFTEKELKRIKEALENEKDLRLATQNDYEELENKYKKLLPDKSSEITLSNIIIDDEPIDSQKNVKTNDDKEWSRILYEKYKEFGIFDEVNELMEKLLTNRSVLIVRSKASANLLSDGLIKYIQTSKNSNGNYFYSITGKGKIYYDYTVHRDLTTIP